ncbi:NAD-dependent epimerase/dehydratase family protein [Spirochaeta isovalerica]|uniref:Nucleoside-diphosphate-sugar epimerase n=1 Tax=Spirochaeta isovalerica TaxID=150 RepID=A0A841R8J7_9SPIO|nr:NAD-dependent epimerase/dehydratase family protein [Spirochaeta isovalerica]MBB6480225.1 nucleoside-diphosphate-sugar epimerase [Spirochaeta isovalerica]
MDRAFVTGATGFVGSTLVDDLLRKGIKVKCAVRKTSSLRWLEGKDVETDLVDLMDPDDIARSMEDCRYVFHLAGTLFAGSEKEYIEGNIRSTAHMVEAALRHRKSIKRFVYVSTIIAAGASSTGKPMTESDDCTPFSWYGKSKFEAEKYILGFKDKLPVTIIRPGAVYGPRDYAMFASFKLSRTGINIILGERNKVGSVIHVQDLAVGISAAALSGKAAGEVYFMAHQKPMRQEEFGETVIRAMGKRPFDVVIPYFLLKIASSLSEMYSRISGSKPILNHQKLLELKEPFIVCSSEKAKRDFGFEASIPLDEGIRSTLQWYRENNWL